MNHTFLAAAALLMLAPFTARADNWPAWRGPTGQGLTAEKDLPTTWSASEHITWKTPLPNRGNSTPILWSDRVFLTSASDDGSKRSVICFDRTSGKRLWQGDTPFTGKEQSHETNPYDSASPTTDGAAVYAWHGSAGVVAYDMEGKALWTRDLGAFDHIWGNAASPVLLGDLVILNAGPGPRSMLVALDKKTGEIAWKTEFPEARGKKPDDWRGSWSTPVIYNPARAANPQIVISLPGAVKSFDSRNGAEIWKCDGLTDLVYTTPLIGSGTIVAMSGYGGSALAFPAPDAKASGDLTSTRLWLHPKNPQRVGSGVISGDYCYILQDTGIAYCIELKTGNIIWHERAANSAWSSMVLTADGLLYVIDQGGKTVILRAAPKYELLHENDLKDTTRASIAVSDGQLFIRTYKALWCIGERKK